MDYKEEQRLLRQLFIAINRVDGAYYLMARAMGLNENKLAVLYALSDGEAHTQKQVGEQWLIPKTTVHSVVQALERDGLAEVVREGRTREKILRLTPEGERYTQALLGQLLAAEHRAIAAGIAEYGAGFVEGFLGFSGLLTRELDAAIRDIGKQKAAPPGGPEHTENRQ